MREGARVLLGIAKLSLAPGAGAEAGAEAGGPSPPTRWNRREAAAPLLVPAAEAAEAEEAEEAEELREAEKLREAARLIGENIWGRKREEGGAAEGAAEGAVSPPSFSSFFLSLLSFLSSPQTDLGSSFDSVKLMLLLLLLLLLPPAPSSPSSPTPPLPLPPLASSPNPSLGSGSWPPGEVSDDPVEGEEERDAEERAGREEPKEPKEPLLLASKGRGAGEGRAAAAF